MQHLEGAPGKGVTKGSVGFLQAENREVFVIGIEWKALLDKLAENSNQDSIKTTEYTLKIPPGCIGQLQQDRKTGVTKASS